MILLYAAAAILAAVFLSAFIYIVIRLRDMHSAVISMSEKMPFQEELRKQATDTIASINERMGSLNQKAQAINDVMNEVTGLRNLFIMPKGAGSAGERLLERALGDILTPDMYHTQHKLSSGTVDFAVRFRDCLVPIDSKLSLEDYNRMLSSTDDAARKTHWRSFVSAVKKRIDETSKYILPNENTTDFALMYIASEGVYYEAFVKPGKFGEENTLFDYALKKRVYPTSPQTIYPYLITILQGMRALRIEENAKEILGKVNGLRNDYERFRAIYSIIAGHIDNAHSKHNNEAIQAIAKLDNHISSLEHTS